MHSTALLVSWAGVCLRGAEELSFSWIGYQSKYNQASYEGNSTKQRLRKQLPSNKRLIDLHSKVKSVWVCI